MYGSGINTLNVYTSKNGIQSQIWTRSYNLGNKWYKAESTVNITQGDYTVSFKAGYHCTIFAYDCRMQRAYNLLYNINLTLQLATAIRYNTKKVMTFESML